MKNINGICHRKTIALWHRGLIEKTKVKRFFRWAPNKLFNSKKIYRRFNGVVWGSLWVEVFGKCIHPKSVIWMPSTEHSFTRKGEWIMTNWKNMPKKICVTLNITLSRHFNFSDKKFLLNHTKFTLKFPSKYCKTSTK